MKRLVSYLLPGLCVFLIGLLIYSGFFQTQEMSAYDWLMRTRPAKAASPEIVIIEIADDTLKSLGRWPLPREFHAALIRVLTDSGCRMIIFDIMFSEPTMADDTLAEAIRKSGRVYLPFAFRIDKELKSSAGVPVSREILGGVADTLKSSVKAVGHINIFVDNDGKVRSLPLWVRHGDKLWPALGFLAAADFLGYPLEKMNLRRGSVSLDRRLTIPLDSQGACWINYSGAWTKTFAHFSYIDVLKAYEAGKKNVQSWFDLSVFKDKICFIGLTAAGTSDFRANPYDPVYPMVGTQANLCDSILRNDFIRRPQPWIRTLIDAGIFLAAGWICLVFSPLPAFLSCCGLGVIYTAIVWSLFSLWGIFPDLFLPLVSIALVYGAVLLRKFFEEAQKRLVLEKELEIAASIQRSFLPPELRRLANVGIRTYLKPAKFIGGDFYDIIILDGSTFGFFIGDVSGKGVSAALIMAQVISLLRVIAQGKRDPAQVLNLLNNKLQTILKGRFVTGQYVVVHAQEGFWEGSSAGHMPLLSFDKRQGTLRELLSSSGAPLGLIENISYETIKRQFVPGDKILMYTDGWIESRDFSGKEFGIIRLKEVFYNSRGEDLDILLSRLESRHKEFERNAPQHDDLTAVILEFF